MKKRKFSFFISLVLLLILLGSILGILPNLPGWERYLLERLANRSAKEYFSGSIRIGAVALDPHFRIRVNGITGKLKTRQGSTPLEIRSLISRDPLGSLILQKPVRFTIEGLRPQNTSKAGISGAFVVQMGPSSRFELSADLKETGLEDWQWLDPQNLGGASGTTKGSLLFRQVSGQEPEFHMDLEAPQPGGNIQARFFDLFLPYLPSTVQKEAVLKISQSQRLIHYRTASLKADLVQSDRLKILLDIFIPDYNLDLKLNADIRTDSKDAFAQIARIMGLIEVK